MAPWMKVLMLSAALTTVAVSDVATAQEAEGNLEGRADARGADVRGAGPRGQEAGGYFGQKSQLAISTDAALSIERRTQEGSKATTTLSILPAMDYFVIDNVSIGGLIGVTYQKAGDDRATSFRLGPRVGYNFALSQLLSVWPKVGFSYSYNKVKVKQPSVGGNDVTVTSDNNAIGLNLFVPLMVHPAPHFFAGFGPFLDTDLNGDNRATTWGFRLTIGGWL